MRSKKWLISPKIETEFVSELKALFQQDSIDGRIDIPPSADICSSLELIVPHLLLRKYPEWKKESLDGIFVAFAKRQKDTSIQIAGTCILISDQSVTPFLLDMELSSKIQPILAIRVFLGESGGGPLGISGPVCNSPDARKLNETLVDRLDSITWSYTVEIDGPVESVTLS